MFCKYCGEPIKDGSKFCPKCGGNSENDNDQVERKNDHKNQYAKVKRIIPVIGVLAILGGAAIIVNHWNSPKQSMNEKDNSSKERLVQVIKHDANDEMLEQTKYSYNSEGRKKSEIYENKKDGIKKEFEYQYEEGEDGGVSKEIKIDKDSGESTETVYEYAANDMLIKTVSYDFNGDILYWYEEDEQGKLIKSINNGEDEEYHHVECEYDEAGNETRRTVYNEDGSIQQDNQQEYDDKKHIVFEQMSGIMEDGTSYEHQYKYKNEYNEDGLIIKCTSYEEQQESSCTVFEYNEDKKIEKEIDYGIEYISENGGEYRKNREFISGITTHEYDDEGREILLIRKDSDNVVESRTETKYDNQGNTISEISVDGEGNINYEVKNEYDKKGNNIKTFSNSPNRYQHTVVCDSDGHVIENKELEANDSGQLVLKEWVKTEYDKKQRMVKESWYNEDGEMKEWMEWKYKKIS